MNDCCGRLLLLVQYCSVCYNTGNSVGCEGDDVCLIFAVAGSNCGCWCCQDESEGEKVDQRNIYELLEQEMDYSDDYNRTKEIKN